MDIVSCVMTTYRRSTCVERSIAMFLAQDADIETELIIYNTDTKYPISLDDSFDDIGNKIKIINNNIDFQTKQDYIGVGAIRRDAKMFATGNYYITWDDDDIFFPWNIRQCMDGIIRTGKSAWKPRFSFMKHFNHEPTLAFNNMEASILVSMDAVNTLGFNMNKTGAEHLGWLDELLRLNDIGVDDYSIPGYCFYWSDPPEIAGHKQSNASEFVREDNFQRHKQFTTDYATRPLTRKLLSEYNNILSPFSSILSSYKDTNYDLYERYFLPNSSIIL